MVHFKYIFEPSSSFLKESYIKRNEIAIACVIMNASLQDVHNMLVIMTLCPGLKALGKICHDFE